MPDELVSGAATWDHLVLGHDATPARSDDSLAHRTDGNLGPGGPKGADLSAGSELGGGTPQGGLSSQPPMPPRSERSPTARLWLGRLITFHVVCLAWIFFRATSFHNAVQVLGRIAALGGHHRAFNWKVAAVVVGAMAVQLGPRGLGARLQALFSRSSIWVQALAVAGVLTAIDLLGPAGVAPFIYFRF
jgi:hypothetical protein